MLRANLTRIRESAVVLDRFVLEVSPAAAGADGQSQSIQKRHADSSSSHDEAESHLGDDLNARLGRESVSMDSRKGLWRRWNLPLCPLETVAVRSLFQNLTPRSESAMYLNRLRVLLELCPPRRGPCLQALYRFGGIRPSLFRGKAGFGE